MTAPVKRFSQLCALLLLSILLFGCSDIIPGQKDRHIIANVNEGERQLTLDRPQEARKWFDRAVAIDPHYPGTYIGFGDGGEGGIIEALTEHNDWPDMVTYLGSAVRDPKLRGDWRLWATLADAQDRLGQEAASKASYQQDLDILTGAQTKKGADLSSMQPVDFLLQKSIAEWGSGDQQQSIDDFHKLIERYPEQAMIGQNTLAYFEAVANTHLSEALTLAQQAVDSDRNNSADDETLGQCLDTLGWVEFRLGKYSDAARDLEEAIGDIPREPISHYHLGMIYRAMGESDDALIELKRAAALDPSSPDTQLALHQMSMPPSPTEAKA